MLNRQSGLGSAGGGEVYPIYWKQQSQPPVAPPQRLYQFPCAAYLEWLGTLTPTENTLSLSKIVAQPVKNLDPDSESAVQNSPLSGLLVSNFKPYLKAGLNTNQQTKELQPICKWSENVSLPLEWFEEILKVLFASLKPGTFQPSQNFNYKTYATGLERKQFKMASSELAAVILSFPASWPDSYCFNLREAVLEAGLVSRAEQVVFVPETTATLLSILPGGGGENLVVKGDKEPRIFAGNQKQSLYNSGCLGYTLILNSGASMTELALVNVPANLGELKAEDFKVLNFSYAGDAIDLDIVCQLLLKGKGIFSPGSYHLSPGDDFPTPGEPELEKRYRLLQKLRAFPQGELLLEAASQLKVILQHQDQFILELGEERKRCLRRDLETRVFVPFVQQLNRELNALLSQTGVPVVAIERAICTGGSAALEGIGRWLRSKLPNASIIQDTQTPTPASACSRVAYGLAALPLHPLVVNWQRHQYSDYFLLLELLTVGAGVAGSLADILQFLEFRGINTRICAERIRAFLDGELPVPFCLEPADAVLLDRQFRESPEFLALQKAALFYKQEDGSYRLNVEQSQRLRHFLNLLAAGSQQKFDEPLGLDLERGLPTV
ncbi:hypothetical protein NG798_15440 [Ancylothrix sp. C2]|uniref:hypothetical protein n=1 Tax=Ancylothrix sp. D3o TaxID=2953691 RepID=UPI0021BBA111|nr:hypothetical protein [Ancylothrix sp. D3o]MCT7951193.1 hypothetical protein [Ancylothrix sp. D3o]